MTGVKFERRRIGKLSASFFFGNGNRAKERAESVTRSCFKDVSTAARSLCGRRKVRTELREREREKREREREREREKESEMWAQ